MSDIDRTFIEMAREILDEAADLQACYTQARQSERETGELVAAIRERIENEQKENADGIVAARTAAADLSRTSTSRKMSEMEADRLARWKPQILPDELALFETTVCEGKTAVSDWRTSKQNLELSLSKMKKMIDNMRPYKLVGNDDPDRVETCLRSDQGMFDALRNSLSQ